ncbi:hypothetical protein Pint_02436 [Pistacia integerrima]|uniref:Uncharacterized protein n=1 Tax=Pistacia integerrima TaxID=434235 RepID=A0ACC0ZPK3_9ROSI|nr:hypothetical protein Pint_02436 [Pistacia integerrima]
MICRKNGTWPFIVNLLMMILVSTYSLIRLIILFVLDKLFRGNSILLRFQMEWGFPVVGYLHSGEGLLWTMCVEDKRNWSLLP